MTRVYRIEHSESNLGPYHHAHKHPDCVELVSKLVLEKSKTPPIYLDTPLANSKTKHLIAEFVSFSKQNLLVKFKKQQDVDLLFGFSTVKQIKDWFNKEELLALKDSGFNLVVYDTVVDNIIKFKKQTVILKTDKTTVAWKQNMQDLLN